MEMMRGSCVVVSFVVMYGGPEGQNTAMLDKAHEQNRKRGMKHNRTENTMVSIQILIKI